MNSQKKEIGCYGEDLAEKYLKSIGYVIIKRNFRCKIGEIDIIAKDKEFITFIEVKSRYGNLYGNPGESITYSKKLKIYKTAEVFICKSKLHYANFRFDVIEIMFNKQNNNYSINLIKDAFQI